MQKMDAQTLVVKMEEDVSVYLQKRLATKFCLYFLFLLAGVNVLNLLKILLVLLYKHKSIIFL